MMAGPRLAEIPVDDFVRDVLRRGAVEGRVFRMPAETLKRSDYAAVNRVLEAIGGKWARRQGGHVFDFDPAGAIAAAVTTGRVVDRKKTLQQFETPEALADTVVAAAAIEPGMGVLEPSAGTGRLCRAIIARGADVAAVELDPLNCDALAQIKGVTYWHADFLEWAKAHQAKSFDRVVMNPPFTGAQDIAHIMAAWPFVKPGGRLVAIASDGAFTRAEWQARHFQTWLAAEGVEVRALPDGAFRESGTMVRARLIIATRRP